MNVFTTQDALNLYGIDSWGAGYFGIDELGYLEVFPNKSIDRRVSMMRVLEELKKSRIKTPLLLRFPQILHSQVNALTDAFDRAMKEFNYQQGYYPVFPIKVNQQYSVVENLLNAGFSKNLGIEVGSKPELVGALAFTLPSDALTICNGYKDQEYLETALLAVKLGKKIVSVVEKPFELDDLISLYKVHGTIPWIGIRIKLNAKGSGLWEKSSGNSSKFGLTTNQLLQSIDKLKEAGLLSYLKMFHFHIGSQITEIRRVKEAIKEAARLYAKARKMGVGIEYLNVGGGLGVDYDGSKTSSDASVNYGVDEYANDVVYNIQDVCENEHVPHPKIVSESGRFLVSYHSALIVDVKEHTSEYYQRKPKFSGKEPQVVQDMLYIYENISIKNYREYYHDALERKDELSTLFNIGIIEIEDRAKGEWLFWAIAKNAAKYSKSSKFIADEFMDLENKMFEKVICNFSVFQSIPDHWALDQLFPVVPIMRLNERPTRKATIVDITCDSDGEVDKFVDLKDIKHALDIHEVKENEPYYLAILMIGAYQDTMGDMHNLFGTVNEAHVILDSTGKVIIQSAKRGDTVGHTLEIYGYGQDKLLRNFKAMVQDRVTSGQINEADAGKLAEEYSQKFKSYPYLT